MFKASRGIEDIYELTYIRKDGSRFPAVVSVTALRDAQDSIIGYLLIGTDNTARKQIEAERQHLIEIQEETNEQLQKANVTLRESEEKLAVTLNSIGDAVIATDAAARVTLLNPLAEKLTGWTLAEAAGLSVDRDFSHHQQRNAATGHHSRSWKPWRRARYKAWPTTPYSLPATAASVILPTVAHRFVTATIR